MRADVRLTVAVVVGMAFASLTILPLTADRGFLLLAWVSVAALSTVGLVLRRLGTGTLAVAATQVLALVVGSLLLAAALSGDTGVFSSLPRLWAEGVLHMQTQASPMEPDPGVTLIFVTVIAVLGLVTDLLVAGIDRPAWSLVPLAALFGVPAVGLGLDTGLLSFACVALAYLGVLVADGLNRTAAWTRGLSRDSSTRSAALGQGGGWAPGPQEAGNRSGPVVWRAAGLLAAPALVLTAVLGLLLPTISLPGIGWGNGPGGSGPLQLTDPSLDLKRNLTQPANRVVFRYTTDQPGGVYLRMASLPQFSAAGFGNTQIRLNAGNDLPRPPGYTGPTPALRTTRVTVEGFGSQYLPLPYAPRSFDAPGDWSYNANSLVVVNRENQADPLRRLSYTVQSWDIAPTPDGLAGAGAATPADADVTAAVPRDLPDKLISLSREVTRGADTPAAKASAIQAYLRGAQFTYSTDRLPGNGYQALVNFLTVDRRGYCEQFAASMAMMARVNGIPARVAVGFLPGQRDGDTWAVSVKDMHAWPELYFANYGWVRFEPTPAVQTGSAPPWTVQGSSSASAAPTESASASASSSTSTASAAPSEAPSETPLDPGTSGSTVSARTVLLSLGAVLLALVLAAPATIRVRRRQTRLDGQGPTAEQVEAAWAEIRDTVVDYGGSWPSGTPRRVGAEVGRRLDGADREAVGRVATLVERSRYARTLDPDAETRGLPGTTQHIRRAISAPAGPARRIRAILAPRSLFRRR